MANNNGKHSSNVIISSFKRDPIPGNLEYLLEKLNWFYFLNKIILIMAYTFSIQ